MCNKFFFQDFLRFQIFRYNKLIEQIGKVDTTPINRESKVIAFENMLMHKA